MSTAGPVQRRSGVCVIVRGDTDSNPAQYERNCRFGSLVYGVGRSAGAPKLPSAGLRLNASKPEARLKSVFPTQLLI